MGGVVPKLLLPLGDFDILTQTLRICCRVSSVSQIVVLCPEGSQDGFLNYKEYLESPPGLSLEVIPGGQTRQESVWKGLQRIAATTKSPDSTYVVVHDGARCFVSLELLERTIKAAFEWKAVITAIPAVDSLVQLGDDNQVRSVDRRTVFSVQTPQVFWLPLLLEAHQKSSGDASDDASLVEKIHPVRMVEGEKRNFKITTVEDYELAKIMIQK